MKTAFPLMRPVVAQRLLAERRAALERSERMAAHAPRCARLLADRFGVVRAYLFGSVVRGTADARSDLDLAVEGLPPERYFEALAALAEVTPFDVDLVRLEEAPPSLRALVLREGRALLPG